MGKTWVLKFCNYLGPNYGICDDPSSPNKTIKIEKSLKGKDKLRIILHELLHASAWDLSEEWVDKSSTDISEILWRLGYRIHEEDKHK